MKKLFTALLLLVGLVSFSQSTGYFRYDSVRFEKVGGNSEFILLNSTRDSIGVLFNMGNGRTRFRTISSLGISPNVANGIKKSVDTLILGDSLNRYTYIYAAHRFLNGSRFNGLQITNDTTTQEPYPFFLTYNPAALSVRRVYSTAKGDIDTGFYGGNASFLWQMFRDSTDALFKAGARSEILPGIGVEAVGQYYPPRDSMVLKVGRDGQSGNVLFGQLDIGHSWGYNMFVQPPSSMPGFPLSAARTSIDLSRVIDNTRRKKMVGSGVSGFTSMYKTYQNSINSSTYPSGSYTDSVFGFTAYGDAYPLISSATKAQTLSVWEVKNAYGFYAHPQYRYTNTVRNGYGFYAAGDSDQNRFNFVRIGGGVSNFLHQLEVTGDVMATDSVHGFIVDGYALSAKIPVAIGTETGVVFGMVDSAQAASITMALPANRDARHLDIRVEGFSSAVYPDNSNGMYIRFETGGNHANVSRINRNGNWTLGNSASVLAYRYWKKLAVDGGAVFRDTVRLEVAPLQNLDTTNYKVVARHITTGDILTMPWAGSGGGGGGSGTVTNVATGYGLSGGPITTTGTVLFDSATAFTHLRATLRDNWNIKGNAATAGSQTGDFIGTTNSVAFRFRTNNTYRMYLDSARNQLILGSPTIDANNALIINSLTNNNFEGLRIFYLNNTGSLAIGPGGMTRAGSINISTSSGQAGLNGTNGNLIGLDPHSVTATALLHVGASTTSKAAMRLASTGALPTAGNILAGNIDAIGDKIYYTISTGPAQKEFTLNDAALTSGRVPFITTNGRLIDNASLTYVSSRLSPTYLTLAASTTAAGTSSAKFGEGSGQTSPEDGTLNYVANNLEFVETSTVYTLAKTLRATATLDFVSTGAQAASELTIAVTGAAVGDPVAIAPSASVLSILTAVAFTAWVSSSGTVTVRFNNYSSGALDPASSSYTVSVIHY